MAERRRLEEQLNQVQKLESIGRLAGGVAHDITTSSGRPELLGSRRRGLGKSHPLQAQLRQIRKAAERASNLTHRLLAFARKQIVEPRVINLGELAQNLDGMLRRLIGEDVELLTVTSPNLWSVKADPHQIEQVLVNLAVNARDAMPQGGTLRIETTNVVVDEAFARRHPTLQVGARAAPVSDTASGWTKRDAAHVRAVLHQGRAGHGPRARDRYGTSAARRRHQRRASWQGHHLRVFIPRIDRRRDDPRVPRPRSSAARAVLRVETRLAATSPRARLSDPGYQVIEGEHGAEASSGQEHDAGQIV